MLTGLGLIGKLIEFLATKLIGRKIDLSLDDRRRACRAFAELYYCVDRLEEITSIFLNELEFLHSDSAYDIINEYHNQSYSIDSVSRRFLELEAELRWTLDVFDPTLAAAVDQLYRFKYSFLYFISNSIELKAGEGKGLQGLTYKDPSPRILKIDMESYYEWVKQHQGKEIDRAAVEWPLNFLWFSEFEEEFTDVSFGVNDLEAAMHFRDVVKAHSKVLAEAREKLREFLIANFKLEEVLYVSKGLPRSWY